MFRLGGDAWRKDREEFPWWVVVAVQAAIFLGTSSNPAVADGVSIESNSENNAEAAEIVGLRRIDDGSVVSNIHTTKWRVFTDNGRDSFLQAGFLGDVLYCSESGIVSVVLSFSF